jgi:Ala-tRNA(Pro) deacylase
MTIAQVPCVEGAQTHKTQSDVLALLSSINIAYELHEHVAVFTVEEAELACAQYRGAHIKNLFLRNKKGRMWVVTCMAERQLDLRALGVELGGGRLSFASPERMARTLGVIPGAVTPLGVVNDVGGEVSLVLDQGIFQFDVVNVHPLVNTMTVAMAPSEVVRFAEHCGHSPRVVDLEQFLRLPT